MGSLLALIGDDLPGMVIISPMIAGIIIVALGWFWPRVCHPLAALVATATAAMAVWLALQVATAPGGVMQWWMGGWSSATDTEFGRVAYAIELVVDRLNAIVAAVIAVVGALAICDARHLLSAELPEKKPYVLAVMMLFIGGALGMIYTGDAFNLYVLLEIASITSYALIAMGRHPAPVAAFNYVMLGSIGACFYLMGIGFLYAATGTLNMADIARHVATMRDSPLVAIAFTFCLVGVALKMALFPLHGWMPNAYSKAPDAVSALLAPTFTKVAVYVLIRLILSVFGAAALTTGDIGQWIVTAGTLAAVYGTYTALRQPELKRALTWILVAEIGYFAGGIGCNNHAGLLGAMLHIPADALAMLTLFLVAGRVAVLRSSYAMTGLRGLFSDRPLLAVALVVGLLTLVGTPPLPSFASKWNLISGALAAGRYDFAAALVIAAALSGAFAFRCLELARQPRDAALGTPPGRRGEGLVALIAALLVVSLGLASAPIGDLLESVSPY